MTAHICFKIGKYLNTPAYKEGIFSIMESITEIEVINLTLLFTDNFGIKKDGLTIPEAKIEIEQGCERVNNMEEDVKQFILENYLEANPEDRE